MYKKLILTFTLAAGLSVLPNAFAAPSNPTPGEPAPKPNTTNTTKHGEDSIDVLAAKGQGRLKGRHSEDSATVLADFRRLAEPIKGSKKPRNHGEDSINVLADFKRRPPPSRPKNNHGLDSTIV